MKRAALLLVLALAGCGPGVVWFGKSPDRLREVVVLQDGAGQHVRVDDRDGKAFLGIGIEALAWSPDGKHLAYPARIAGGWVLVVDGVEGPAFDGIGEVAWSADGAHHAYAAEQRGRWLVVRDGQPGPTVETLRAHSLRFSGDGAHLGYIGDEEKKVIARIDGVKSAPYDSIGGLSFGEKGRAAFVARRGKETFVVVSGKESAAYEDVAELGFSPSGRRIAWTARKDKGWRVVVDGIEGEQFDRISKLVWAPRGDGLAYGAGRGSTEMVVAGGVIGAAYEGILPGSVAFDASGTRVAFAGRRDRAWHIVNGTEESPPYEQVEAPVFIGDSSAVAHVARRGEASFVVLDGNQGPVHADASQLVLSPDGRRFLCSARFGAVIEVIEGAVSGGPCGGGHCKPVEERSSRHDVIVGGTLVFSADGAHSGFLAGQAADRKLFLVIDGARGGAFDLDELMAGFVVEPELGGAFTGDSRLLSQWVRAEVGLAGRRTGAGAALKGRTERMR
jgi:hypothetical protein